VIILILLIRRKNKELEKIEGNNPLDAWSFSGVKKSKEGKNFLIFFWCAAVVLSRIFGHLDVQLL